MKVSRVCDGVLAMGLIISHDNSDLPLLQNYCSVRVEGVVWVDVLWLSSGCVWTLPRYCHGNCVVGKALCCGDSCHDDAKPWPDPTLSLLISQLFPRDRKGPHLLVEKTPLLFFFHLWPCHPPHLLLSWLNQLSCFCAIDKYCQKNVQIR